MTEARKVADLIELANVEHARLEHLEHDLHETIAPNQAKHERQLADLRRAVSEQGDDLARLARRVSESERELADLKKHLAGAAR